MMGALRAGFLLAGFAGLTVPLLPVQELLLRAWPSRARTFPHWYHRRVCALLGIRLHISGEVCKQHPVLLVSNHTSWLDIPVLSAVAPVSFVAKKEVGGWPGVSTLARLQRTVFVDRNRRAALGGTTSEIRARLETGDTLVLFAEGTSSNGNQVLPFRSSLFAGAMAPRDRNGARREGSPGNPLHPIGQDNGTSEDDDAMVVQTVALAYTRRFGIPLGRADRGQVGWYGDMEMQSHAWGILKAGPLDVEIIVGPPVRVGDFADRKGLAGHTEDEVRKNLATILRARAPSEEFELAPLNESLRRSPGFVSSRTSKSGGMR